MIQMKVKRNQMQFLRRHLKNVKEVQVVFFFLSTHFFSFLNIHSHSLGNSLSDLIKKSSNAQNASLNGNTQVLTSAQATTSSQPSSSTQQQGGSQTTGSNQVVQQPLVANKKEKQRPETWNKIEQQIFFNALRQVSIFFLFNF